MIEGIRYAHTNLIANDWRSLAAFYVDLLGCTPVLPERCSTVASPKVSAVTASPAGCSAAGAKRPALCRGAGFTASIRTPPRRST